MISDIRTTVVNKDDIIELLSERHTCQSMQKNRFYSIIFQLPSNQHIFVMHSEKGELQAIITMFTEQRLSDAGLCIAHITDLVISKKIKNQVDIQTDLLNYCINRAIDLKCIKIAVHSEQLREECLRQRFTRDSPGFTLSLLRSF